MSTKQEELRLSIEQKTRSEALNRMMVRYETELYRLETWAAMSRSTHAACLLTGVIAGWMAAKWLL